MTSDVHDTESGRAIRQRDGQTLAALPHFPAGLVTPAVLRRIADAAEKFDVKVIKLTSGSRMALVGLTDANITAFWSDLALPPAPLGATVRSVRACPGDVTCRRALGDALSLGLDLDAKFLGQPMPATCKISVSGCGNDCSEAAVRDVGLIAVRNGWRVLVGGNVGRHPRMAKEFGIVADNSAARGLVEAILSAYAALARRRERLGALIERVGLATFRARVETEAATLAHAVAPAL